MTMASLMIPRILDGFRLHMRMAWRKECLLSHEQRQSSKKSAIEIADVGRGRSILSGEEEREKSNESNHVESCRITAAAEIADIADKKDINVAGPEIAQAPRSISGSWTNRTNQPTPRKI